MGGCLSYAGGSDNYSVHQNQKATAANVVSINGDLRQYSLPATASQVLNNLHTETEMGTKNCFVCNSDRLCYDDYIPALELEEELEGGQLYFVLPSTKLNYRLSASDMAALAVKASVALQLKTSSSSSRRRRTTSYHHDKQRSKNKSRISPLLLIDDDDDDDVVVNRRTSLNSPSSSDGLKKKNKKKTLILSDSDKPAAGHGLSKSKLQLQRYSSRRAKMAVRSFRLRLTTIYEGSVLQFY